MISFKATSLLAMVIVLFEPEECKSINSSNPFIWQGTHWCGIGKSESQEEERPVKNVTKADKCCKEHDSCPHYISRWSKKYNLFNWRLYTISQCSCDKKFRRCLEQDDSMISKDIRRIYFNLLQVPCFEIELKPTKTCAAWHWYLKCKTYKEWLEPYATIKELKDN